MAEYADINTVGLSIIMKIAVLVPLMLIVLMVILILC
jgi:hypothetical protein